jgi:hypothetical protein
MTEKMSDSLKSLVDCGAVEPHRLSEYTALSDGVELVPGEYVGCSALFRAAPGDKIDLYILPKLWWGDYTGSDMSRSNHRSLLRDYPEVFVELTGDFCAFGLGILPFCAFGLGILPEFDHQELAEILVELHDGYPLYDEDDHSALTAELAEEAWEGFLQWDVPAMLEDAGIDVVARGIGLPELREAFYRLYSEFGDEYAETAVSVVFPSLARAVDRLADEIRRGVIVPGGVQLEIREISELLKPCGSF